MSHASSIVLSGFHCRRIIVPPSCGGGAASGQLCWVSVELPSDTTIGSTDGFEKVSATTTSEPSILTHNRYASPQRATTWRRRLARGWQPASSVRDSHLGFASSL